MLNFYNYKGELLKEYVIKNKTDELLNNDELRSYLLQNENHYAFVWLVQDLDEKSKSILLNNSSTASFVARPSENALALPVAIPIFNAFS